MLCTPCGEVDRPTSSTGGRLLRSITLGSNIGPIEDFLSFDTEGCFNNDVKVPIFRANACTDEVENCRQIAATNTVILQENPNNETPESSGQPAAKGVTLRAKGDLQQEPQPFQKKIWSIVPCS